VAFVRQVLRHVLALLMLVIVASVGAGVFFRYVLGTPLFWSDEVARFALVWITFLGAAVLMFAEGGHITVEFLLTRTGAPARRVMELIADLIVLIISGVVVIGSYFWMFARYEHLSSALNIPMGYVYVSIPLGAMLGVLVVGRRVLRRLRGDGAPWRP
jgi:TRAP-type transport system small permease protein